MRSATRQRLCLFVLVSGLASLASAAELEVQNWKEVGAIQNGPQSLVVECLLVGNAAWTEITGGARLRIRGGRGGAADYAYLDLEATDSLAAAVEGMIVVDPSRLPFPLTVAEFRSAATRGGDIVMRMVPSTSGRRTEIQFMIGSEAMGIPVEDADSLVTTLRQAHSQAVAAGAR